MAHLVFHEKPACAGNARQRALLAAAGHTLQRLDLRSHSWTPEQLLGVLDPLPVAPWFIRAAPRAFFAGDQVADSMRTFTSAGGAK